MMKELFKIRSLLIGVLLFLSFNSPLFAEDSIKIETTLAEAKSVEASTEFMYVFRKDTPEIF